MDEVISFFGSLAPVAVTVSQLGFAVAAFKLAKALKVRVEDHEVRIRVLEK